MVQVVTGEYEPGDPQAENHGGQRWWGWTARPFLEYFRTNKSSIAWISWTWFLTDSIPWDLSPLKNHHCGEYLSFFSKHRTSKSKTGNAVMSLVKLAYSDRKHDRVFTPQMVVKTKGHPRKFQGNLAWWKIFSIWPEICARPRARV